MTSVTQELQRIYVSWRQPLLLSWAFLGPKSQVMRNKRVERSELWTSPVRWGGVKSQAPSAVLGCLPALPLPFCPRPQNEAVIRPREAGSRTGVAGGSTYTLVYLSSSLHLCSPGWESPPFSQARALHRAELGSPRGCQGQGWTLTEGSSRGAETQPLFHLTTNCSILAFLQSPSSSATNGVSLEPSPHCPKVWRPSGSPS